MLQLLKRCSRAYLKNLRLYNQIYFEKRKLVKWQLFEKYEFLWVKTYLRHVELSSNKNWEISYKQADVWLSAPTPCLLHRDTQQVGLVLEKGAEFTSPSFVSKCWSKIGLFSPPGSWTVNGGAWKLIHSQYREPREEEEAFPLTRLKMTIVVELRLVSVVSCKLLLITVGI